MRAEAIVLPGGQGFRENERQRGSPRALPKAREPVLPLDHEVAEADVRAVRALADAVVAEPGDDADGDVIDQPVQHVRERAVAVRPREVMAPAVIVVARLPDRVEHIRLDEKVPGREGIRAGGEDRPGPPCLFERLPPGGHTFLSGGEARFHRAHQCACDARRRA